MIKKNLIKIKEAVVNLTMRVESSGDSKFLRMRNTEQALRLITLQAENGRLREQLKSTSLKTSPARKRRVGEKITVAPDIEYFAAGESSDGEKEGIGEQHMKESPPSPPPKRPALKGVSRKISTLPLGLPSSPLTATSRKKKNGNENKEEECLTRKIEDLVAQRREVRARRRGEKVE